MNLPLRVVWLSWLIVLGIAGCQQADRFEQVVTARSPLQFTMWRARLADSFNLQERKEFDAALQEIRLGVMLENEASGSAGVDEAVRAKIDGKSVRAAVALGYETKWQRLQKECRALDGLIRSMSRVSTKPGDEASAKFLDARREKHRQRLQADQRELAATEEQLKRLLGPAYVPTVDDPEEKPVLIPRGAKA